MERLFRDQMWGKKHWRRVPLDQKVILFLNIDMMTFSLVQGCPTIYIMVYIMVLRYQELRTIFFLRSFDFFEHLHLSEKSWVVGNIFIWQTNSVNLGINK